MKRFNITGELFCAAKFFKDLSKACSGHSVICLAEAKKYYVGWHILLYALLLHLLQAENHVDCTSSTPETTLRLP